MNFGPKPVQYAQSQGPDAEISDSVASVAFAEKKLAHKLTTQNAEQNNVQYGVMNLGPEEDVSMTQANIAESEKMYG